MPFADASVEIVTCAFALHHFSPGVAAGLLCEMARVARIGVIVTDLCRSHAAYWGARLLALGFRNRLTRHDGPLSVLRAYTAAEVRSWMARAGLRGMVHAEPLFRLVMTIEASHQPVDP
jgi:ubiquinone/menaquinone biosynthesis C-methylase UbiE